MSQQPDKSRLPGQCSVSDNFRPDVVRGLTNRPGTFHKSYLPSVGDTSLLKWYFYSRSGEEYFISVSPEGTLKAWSPDGTQHTVNDADGSMAAYLACANPATDLEMETVGDFTFIINKTRNVYPSSELSPPVANKALIYVQFMDYAQTIKVNLNGSNCAAFNSGPGTEAAQREATRTEYITSKLLQLMNTGEGGTWELGASWSGVDVSATFNIYSHSESVIVVERHDGGPFTIDVSDGANNENSVAIKGVLTATNLLPKKAPADFIVEINPPGGDGVENSSYFLRAETATDGTVIWRETLKPGTSVGLDLNTMPRVLVRESIAGGVATFTLRQGEWEGRKVGNLETNPHPSFVNEDSPSPIKSIGLFQSRLFVTGGESIIMSGTNSFFNFYRETAQAALATDGIDVFSDVPEVTELTASIPFDGDLAFFSKKAQFLLAGDKPITKENATLTHTTSFETYTGVAPVASGDNIFFPFNYGGFTGIREYFTDSVTDTKKARPVTDHVKKYIQGLPTIMKASTSLNLLLIKAAVPNVLYAHDWLWQGSDKVQSAWGRLIFPGVDDILHLEFADATLYLVLKRGSAVTVETIDLGDGPQYGWPVRLDRKVDQVMVKTAGKSEWKTEDPYPTVPVEELVMIRGAGAYEEDIGASIYFTRVGSELVTDEDLSTTDVEVTIGTMYSCSFVPTNPVAKDQNGLALGLDRLVVSAMHLNYNTTGDVTATVLTDSGNNYSYEYSNRTMGGPENIVGFAPLVDGTHRTPIKQKSDKYTLTYTTSSYLPLEIRDLEYSGNLNRRGLRM